MDSHVFFCLPLGLSFAFYVLNRVNLPLLIHNWYGALLAGSQSSGSESGVCKTQSESDPMLVELQRASLAVLANLQEEKLRVESARVSLAAAHAHIQETQALEDDATHARLQMTQAREGEIEQEKQVLCAQMRAELHADMQAKLTANRQTETATLNAYTEACNARLAASEAMKDVLAKQRDELLSLLELKESELVRVRAHANTLQLANEQKLEAVTCADAGPETSRNREASQAKLGAYEAQLAKAQAKIASSEAIQATLATCEVKLEIAKATIAELESSETKIHIRFREAQHKHNARKAKAERARLQQTIDGYEADREVNRLTTLENAELLEELANAQAQGESADARLVQAMTELSSAQALLLDTQEKLASIEAKRTNTEVQLASIRTRLDSTEARLANAQAKLTSTKDKLERAHAKLTDWDAQLTDAEDQSATMQAKIAAKEEVFEKTQEALKEITERYGKGVLYVQDLLKELAELRDLKNSTSVIIETHQLSEDERLELKDLRERVYHADQALTEINEMTGRMSELCKRRRIAFERNTPTQSKQNS